MGHFLESEISDSDSLSDGTSACDDLEFVRNIERKKLPNDIEVIRKVGTEINQVLSGVCNSRCYVCDRLVNDRAVRVFDFKYCKSDVDEMKTFIDQIVVEDGKYDMCSTCFKYVQKKQIPPCAVVNGFKYLPIPDDLPALTEVEEHLVALRIPFQQIVHLGSMGKFGQYGCKGSVINVPIDTPEVIRQIIPLLPEEDELYIVNLKRKLIHKRAYARNFVNCENLKKWCVFLEKSSLYREFNVKFDESRLINHCIDSEVGPQISSTGDVVYGKVDNPENHEEMFSRLGSIQNTLLAEDRYCNTVNAETDEINIAPGEKQRPISVVWDRKAEELSFPTIYLGESRPFKNYVTRYQAMKSEIRRYDRRSAKPQNVLYKFNVHLREQAASRLRHKFKRSCKEVSGNLITKEELLDKDFVAIFQKKGISMPCLMPNSAEFWRGKSHELFAMVRQLGRPHLFLTLSFAEYHSPILINILKRLNKETFPLPQCTEKSNAVTEIEISPEEKLRLIRDDPIVCATYFREMVLLLKKYLRFSVNGPMGEHFMLDWFFRIEFQQRGSPHVHCLLWLNNCVVDPLKDKDSAIQLIDRLITCDSSNPVAVKNQHKHTSTCFKNKLAKQQFAKKQLSIHECHKYCRFGAPFWPTNQTRIVLPLYEEEDERKVKTDVDWSEYIVYLKELRLKLKDIFSSEDCPDNLDEIWLLAGCPDDETYELAIRTGIVRATVLYKRNVSDRWTNSYLHWVLNAFTSNDDCQMVLDVYSLIRYCVSYVTKGEKSHSKLHQEIMELRKHTYYHQSVKRRSKARIIRYRKFRENSEDVEERENFYRTMCTLYVPWRDEFKDILEKGSVTSFYDLYLLHESNILKLRKQFEFSIGLENVLDRELDKCVAEDDGEQIFFDLRSVITGDSKIVFEDDNEVAEYMDCHSQNLDIDFGNNDGSHVIPFEVRRRGIWDRQTFLDNIRMLNVKQREVVLAVIDGIRLGSKPRLIFVDGVAGTGKSVVAKNIANAFETFCPGSNDENCRVVISAFTGKAAYNIDGLTMHQVYKLSLNQEHGASKRLRSGDVHIMNPLQGEALANLQNNFSNVFGQIIDEISLVSDRNFLSVDQRCKEAKSNNLDFGGLWTIVFGDFRQLSPVGGKSVFASSTDSIAGSDLLWRKFEYVELDQNMRQGEDKVFAEILTQIGEGEKKLSEESLDLIESRFVTENNLTVPKNCVRLFYRNKCKDRFNEREVVKKYEVGESYKLTVNQCVQDGLVNGAIGILKFVEVDCTTDKCKTGNIGQMTSKKSVAKLQRAIKLQTSFSDSLLSTLSFTLPSLPTDNDLLRLVPITLADTIHSSQGSTYDNVCVEYSEGMENEMVYVGMSRVRRLSGLFLNYT
ncbi:ATP-dependent DNA helicase, partial [Frankliniella fusca]